MFTIFKPGSYPESNHVTLLTLITLRGNIDCGSAQYVLIRYGNFWEFVKPVNKGHISVGIHLDADPLDIISLIEEGIKDQGHLLL